MIEKLTHTTVRVLDQDRAYDFYTRKLGFQLHTDARMDHFRWLTVSPPKQPDHEIILLEPGPPMMNEESARQVKPLVAEGMLGAAAFQTSDCRGSNATLTERAVSFLSEPSRRPSGTEATLWDKSGNWFSVMER